MNSFIFGFLGVLLGFLLVALIIYFIVKRFLRRTGLDNVNIKELKEEIESIDKDRPKEIGGMTSIYLPQIVKDIKNFNLDEIYLLTEKSLRSIFQAIENKDLNIINSKDFNLINKKLKIHLEDLIDSDIIYRYDDIKFHKNVIKSYTKDRGVYKIVISSSLEYYYKKMKHDKVLEESKDKVQKAYDTSFVYIVDESAYNYDINVYGLNCPNCGAVIKSLETKECSYCHTGFNIEVIDLLKCWKLIDYKEIN